MEDKQSHIKALSTANSFLTGKISAIEACCALASVSPYDLIPQEDMSLFVGVASETDHLPVGTLQRNWHPDFIEAKLNELADYEARVYEPVRNACQRIVIALDEK